MVQEGWKKLPNRDEVLDRIYSFIRFISNGENEEAEKLVFLKEKDEFYQSLQKNLEDFLEREMEDDDLSLYSADRIKYISDPDQIDENLVMPVFTGNSITVEEGEQVSLFVAFAGEITPVKITFSVFKTEGIYSVKYDSVTTDLFGD